MIFPFKESEHPFTKLEFNFKVVLQSRVLKLYYQVASSQLPAPQIAPRTKVVLQSRQFSASSSTDCSAY